MQVHATDGSAKPVRVLKPGRPSKARDPGFWTPLGPAIGYCMPLGKGCNFGHREGSAVSHSGSMPIARGMRASSGGVSPRCGFRTSSSLHLTYLLNSSQELWWVLGVKRMGTTVPSKCAVTWSWEGTRVNGFSIMQSKGEGCIRDTEKDASLPGARAVSGGGCELS